MSSYIKCFLYSFLTWNVERKAFEIEFHDIHWRSSWVNSQKLINNARDFFHSSFRIVAAYQSWDFIPTLFFYFSWCMWRISALSNEFRIPFHVRTALKMYSRGVGSTDVTREYHDLLRNFSVNALLWGKNIWLL